MDGMDVMDFMDDMDWMDGGVQIFWIQAEILLLSIKSISHICPFRP